MTALFVFIGLIAFYLYPCAPTVTLGDSAELCAVGATLGVGHSPGYPLFAVLGRLWTAILPWGSPAYRMNVFSVLCCAGTLAVLVVIVQKLGGSDLAALATAFIVGLSPLGYRQAQVCEVFALNSVIGMGLLGSVLFVVTSKNSLTRVTIARAAALLLGLGLGNHHTLILFGPVLLLAMMWIPERRDLRLWAELAAFALVGLSIYLFLPLRARQLPVMDWEEPATWRRFWKLVTRARYGTFQLVQGNLPGLGYENLRDAVAYTAALIWENFRWMSLIIVAGVAAVADAKRYRAAWLSLIAFVCAGPLFFWITQLHPTPHTRILLDRFFYLPLVPLSVLAGLGLAMIESRLGARRGRMTIAALLALAMVVDSRAVGAGERFNVSVWDFGRDILRNVPTGSLLFDDRADESEFAVAYLQRVERFRPDVEFIDCNAGVSRSIYGPDYYEVWGAPRLALRHAEEQRMIESAKRPVFYATHDPRMIPIDRVQQGLVFAVTGHATLVPHLRWDQLLVYRVARNARGLPAGWDRGLHADYLQVLAEDARMQGDFASAWALYSGVFAYEGRSAYQTQMENYLRLMMAHHAG